MMWIPLLLVVACSTHHSYALQESPLEQATAASVWNDTKSWFDKEGKIIGDWFKKAEKDTEKAEKNAADYFTRIDKEFVNDTTVTISELKSKANYTSHYVQDVASTIKKDVSLCCARLAKEVKQVIVMFQVFEGVVINDIRALFKSHSNPMVSVDKSLSLEKLNRSKDECSTDTIHKECFLKHYDQVHILDLDNVRTLIPQGQTIHLLPCLAMDVLFIIIDGTAAFFLVPFLAEAAILGLGFAEEGVIAESIAAGWHSAIGAVEKGSVFSSLQSIGAVGVPKAVGAGAAAVATAGSSIFLKCSCKDDPPLMGSMSRSNTTSAIDPMLLVFLATLLIAALLLALIAARVGWRPYFSRAKTSETEPLLPRTK